MLKKIIIVGCVAAGLTGCSHYASRGSGPYRANTACSVLQQRIRGSRHRNQSNEWVTPATRAKWIKDYEIYGCDEHKN